MNRENAEFRIQGAEQDAEFAVDEFCTLNSAL
jgi:hypothetical protein